MLPGITDSQIGSFVREILPGIGDVALRPQHHKLVNAVGDELRPFLEKIARTTSAANSTATTVTAASQTQALKTIFAQDLLRGNLETLAAQLKNNPDFFKEDIDGLSLYKHIVAKGTEPKQLMRSIRFLKETARVAIAREEGEELIDLLDKRIRRDETDRTTYQKLNLEMKQNYFSKTLFNKFKLTT